MDYAGFLRAQHQALLDQWLAAVNVAYIALPDEASLTELEDLRLPGGGGHWLPLPGFAPAEARRFRAADGRPQLWVRPEEKDAGSGLYARAWAAFARVMGFPDTPSVVGGRRLAIDHLFPETAAARRGWLLVRVMPVDLRANSLVGATAEKVEAARPGRARKRTATALTIAKVTGFQGSFARRHDAHAVAAALVAHIQGCGLVVPAGALGLIEREIANTAWLIGRFRP